MNSIPARRVPLALGLAALALSSGCASNRKEGPELNPKVTAKPCFVGTHGLHRAELEIEVEQREPYVARNHTWSVHMWTSRAGSDVLSQGQVDAMMSAPPFRSMPDLNARRDEVEFKALDYRVPGRGGYLVVVVAAVEMTKGPHPEVHAVKTYATAFKDGGEYNGEVEIPEYPPVIPPPKISAAAAPAAAAPAPAQPAPAAAKQ